ncbi:MAG TPA: cytochrome c3 family protein [Opitutaceae bacterium]|jgi:hypothetical protein
MDPKTLRDPHNEPLFKARDTTIFRVLLAFAALLVIGSGTMAYAYFHSGYWNRVGIAPPQPILFSHRHHAGELKIDCRNCHPTVETGAFAGMPSTHTCLTCHSQIFTNTVMIRPLVESAESGSPIEWNRVNRLPDHVYFNHSIHIAKGVACFTCHGDVGKDALMVKGQPLIMRWCVGCHRDPGARLSQPGDLFDALAPAKPPKATPAELLAFYHVRTAVLTNCSTCHH